MEEQGELDHYVFEKEQVSAEEETLWKNSNIKFYI
jgi:hypothetical protein